MTQEEIKRSIRQAIPPFLLKRVEEEKKQKDGTPQFVGGEGEREKLKERRLVLTRNNRGEGGML